MDDQRTTFTLPPIWQKSMQKTIHLDVCRNGDGNFRKKVVVNRKQQPTFDSWLKDMSVTMKLQTGSVWRVFTPTHGHRIEDYEQLESHCDCQNGNLLVLAGKESFKPLRYGEINPTRRKSPPRNLDHWEPNKRYQVTSGKYKKIDTQATVIRCWANGRGKDGSKLVVLPAHRNRPDNVKDVVRMVSHVMGDHCGGAVCSLYEMSGAKVRSMEQIRQNGCYVAAKRREIFTDVTYQEHALPGLRFSPRLPSISSSTKTSSHSSPEHSTTSHNGNPRERAKKHPDDQVFTRPTKHKRSSERPRQTDYDHDNGGVFKAKNPNRATRGAREVEDSRTTRTELPVDQREAETVQDEDLDYLSPQNDRKEDKRSKEARERRGRKEEEPNRTTQPDSREKDRPYRSNARRADSPSEEQARREREEREKEARAKREAEDRARKEKQQQQQEALRRKKKEKEEQERRKREEEEDERWRKKEAEKEKQQQQQRRRKEDEEKQQQQQRRRKEDEEKERQQQQQQRRRKEDEERKRNKEEEERRRRKAGEKKTEASRRSDSPSRYEDTNKERSAPNSPAPNNNNDDDDRPATATRKDSQQEERAATKIQAGYRGYRDRQDLKQKKAEKEEEEQAATKIQAGYRGYRERQDLKQRREEMGREGRNSAATPSYAGGDDDDPGPPPLDDDDEQEKAATKLQAGFRGVKARRQVKAMREEKEVKDADPIPPPDNDIDHDLDPNAQQDAEHAAATKIQSAFRGHQTRKELAQGAPRRAEGGEQSG